MTSMRIAPSLATIVLISGCDASFVERGVIQFGNEPAYIESPTSVSVHASFSVRVATFGDGCVSYDSTDVSVEGPDTVIEPYDRNSGADVCTSIGNTFLHDVTLRFDAVGPERIQVRGRRIDRGTDEVIEI